MEKEQDLISVIVPVYNIKEYLERCVDSILAQTWKNLEVLLVDDGSTDGTEKLVDELTKKDARIRVFHKKNGGSSSARNLGIREAKGRYLGRFFFCRRGWAFCSVLRTSLPLKHRLDSPLSGYFMGY